MSNVKQANCKIKLLLLACFVWRTVCSSAVLLGGIDKGAGGSSNASAQQLGEVSNELKVHVKPYCTRNERRCETACQVYSPYMCLMPLKCGPWCFLVDCNEDGHCPRGQMCAEIRLFYGEVQMSKKCYCPPGLVPSSNGTCIAQNKCSAELKDRYCDQMCQMDDDSKVTCSCGTKYKLKEEKRQFGSYGACTLEESEFESQKVILNGPKASGWKLSNKHFITLAGETVVDRVQMRPTEQMLQHIYGITKDADNRLQMSLFSSKGHKLPGDHPLLYSLDVVDFCIDWPSGNVYYISSSEPKLAVCTINGTACRILEAASQLEDPKEIVIDSSLQWLLIADSNFIYRTSLDGLKTLKIGLASGAGLLTMDYENSYLHYLSAHDSSVYRLNYSLFDRHVPPQQLFQMQKMKSYGEFTAMAALGRSIYLAEYNATSNISYLYNGISTNPLGSQQPSVIASGPGRIKDILIYHHALVRLGPGLNASIKCHMTLKGRCTCMEGFYQDPSEGICKPVNISESGKDVLLYTSTNKQLIQGMFVSPTMKCPTSGLGVVPINPIRLPRYVNGKLDIHMGYDPVDKMIYFSDQTAIRKAKADGVGFVGRLKETGWRARGGSIVYGLVINPSLRLMYYAEYSRMEYKIVVASLDHPKMQTRYKSSPRAGRRYFSTGLVGSRYEFRVFGLPDSLPVVHGTSMLHARTNDPVTGYFYDVGLSGRSEGYDYLLPNATLLSRRATVVINESLVGLTMGNNSILHFSTILRQYGMVNASDSTKVLVCDDFKMSALLYIRPTATVDPMPSGCDNCTGLCLQEPIGNFTCIQTNETIESGANCEGDDVVCPGTAKCIKKSQLCDGKGDCAGQEDEKNFTYCFNNDDNSCADGLIRCNETSSRECIPADQRCDGVVQCMHGEDEKHCTGNCLQFTCPNSGTCYGLEGVCDGISDCPEFTTEHYSCANCQSSAFQCNNTNSCLPNNRKCDGFTDCPDGSDELGCEEIIGEIECELNEKKCVSGQCIPEIWWCDGAYDCADRTDELSSCQSVICPVGLIKCNSTGKCISPTWRCDMHFDCADDEDEWGCEVRCAASEFACPNATHNVTKCISKSRLCDSWLDCPLGHDETDNCASEACQNHQCSHDCVVDPETGGAVCLCPSGHVLEDTTTCIEKISNCSQWGVCSQVCVDLEDGAHRCDCHENYQIDSDLFTCRRKDGPASLIFSNRHDLRLLPTEPSNQHTALISSLRNTIAVDYHYDKNYVFWSDVIADKIYRGTRNPDPSRVGLVNIKVVVTHGLPTAEGLAVDWIGDHIYWVESGLDIIEVADLDGNNRTTIISHREDNQMENPRSIAVDPRVGLLFWADWGIKEIRRATMAGKHPIKLFAVNDPRYIPDGGWANGLTLDYDLKRVYWNDAKSDTIQTVDYEGKDFHLVLSHNSLLMHPFAISVFENWVYWSDWRKNSINRANKWTGENAETVQSTVTQPFDLKVYHKGRQPPVPSGWLNSTCASDNGQCSHLCLQNETTVLCGCPHLLQLNTDGKTCKGVDSFLLIGITTFLTSLSLRNDESYGVMPTLAAPVVDKLYMLDYYMVAGDEEKRLFWADESLSSIATATIDGSEPSNIIDLPIGFGKAVEYGFAVDYINKRLYITTYSLKTSVSGGIDVCDFAGNRRSTIVHDLKKPTRIVVQPSNGSMFVLDERANAIYSMHMNGSYAFKNQSSSNIVKSSDGISDLRDMNLVLSSNDPSVSQLYFGNAMKIYRYDGVTIHQVSVSKVHKWTVHEDMLFFANKFENASLPAGFDVMSRSLVNTSGSPVKVGSVKGPLPQDIKFVDSSKTVSVDDKAKCSGCNHHCLPPNDHTTGYGTCVCYSGFKYQDGSCQEIMPMLLYAASSSSSKREIGAAELNAHGTVVSNLNSLPRIPQVYKPSSIFYYHRCDRSETDFIYWIDSGHKIMRTSRDLTERQTILSGLIAAQDLIMDPQTGNLFWIDSFTGTVEVCKADGTQRLVLAQIAKDDNNKLVAIALHPSKGYLYYLESVNGITRISLGQERQQKSIRSTPTGGGSAMAVDTQNNKLLVCDGLHQIVSMDLDGIETEYSVGLKDNSNCVAIVTNGSQVYYSLSRGPHSEIFMGNLAQEAPRSIMNLTEYVKDLSLAEHITCSYLAPNPCSKENGDCEGLCLFNGNVSEESHCVCAMGMLDSSKKKCEDVQDFVVYSKVNAIEFHSVHVSNATVAPPFPTLQSNMTRNVIALATDSDRRLIYYSDIQRKTISWASYNGSSNADLITNIDSVEGLAYANNHLYFTYQSDHPAIKYVVLNSDKPKAENLLTLAPSDAPRAIAVHSCSGVLFWTNWNEANPSIQRVETSGAHFTSIITENIAIPNGLAIDYKTEKLFWADANLDKIEMCDFWGRDCVVVHKQMSPHIFAMAIHGDYLYWTDWMQRAVRMAYKLGGSVNQTLVAKLPRQPMGIAVASQTTCKVSPCFDSACEQKCSVIGNGEGRACGCFDGYVVDSSRPESCKLVQGCQDGFACEGDCIPWELTCDGVQHCPTPATKFYSTDENPFFCATRVCPDKNYLTCRNHRCVPIDMVCNGFDDCGDLSDEFNCTKKCNTAIQFQCTDKECIPLYKLCDGTPDCFDKSDELPPHCNDTHNTFIDCTEFVNPFYGVFSDGIKCAHTPVCILDVWKCDGHNDCWDNSDEADCDEPSTCTGDDHWECAGVESQPSNIKQCILKAWLCDGDMDCKDESDEMNCKEIKCPDGDFRCNNSNCIPEVWRCDGKADCSDRSDELDCSSSPPPLLQCSSVEFMCADSNGCVHRSFLCDGEQDCADGSDEHPSVGCPPAVCGLQQFGCANGRCIPTSFVCDRDDDCLDNSDEPSSCGYAVCNPLEQFTCADKSCVSLTAHCNGWPDCPDGSDEAPETCAKPVNLTCPEGEWRCPQGNCIDEAKLCDGIPDCDFDDELACNLNECMELNGGCNQQCFDEKIHFHCGCYQGFKLLDDKRTCVDIDECELYNPCAQFCLNKPGGYLCSCAPGYQLSTDKSSCKATRGSAAYLLVANRYYIRNVSLQIISETNRSTQQLVTKDALNAVALDYDWRDQMIYWTDVTNDVHNISRMFMNGTGKQVLHSTTLRHPDGLAVDWIGRNLYWCDNILNTIQVSKLDGRYRKVLLNAINEPRSIQLHPRRGYLFYTDWGQDAHIGRAGMDGTSHQPIITEGVGWPNALAVDPYADRLFFGDAKIGYIAMTDLDGSNKQVILSEAVGHIFSLSVYDNSLYWSDWKKNQIHRVHKFSGEHMDTLIDMIHRPMEIRVVHELIQLHKGPDPCEALNCTGLCLLRPREGAKAMQAVCACAEFFKLDNDNRTCVSICNGYSQVQCDSNSQCLHFTQRCDGHQDCVDGSDEKDCGQAAERPCKSLQFHCYDSPSNSSAECVDAEQLCDGREQCSHGEDEKIYGDCELYTCVSQYYHHCYNETHYLCLNATEVCQYGSAYTCPQFDSALCTTGECKSSQFQCKGDRRCVPAIYRCDGEDDCADGSDEWNSTCTVNKDCAPHYIHCNQSGQCIPEAWMCDGEKDCINGQDEDSSHCGERTCADGYSSCGDGKCIPQRWLCDYDKDCQDGSDEANCNPRPCSESEFKCLSDQKCIHGSKKCDSFADCSDGSDEQNCDGVLSCDDVGHFKCKNGSQCVPAGWKCDGTPDCKDVSDELDCIDKKCAPDEFRCANSLCISHSFKCDTQNDCLDGSDELPSTCDGQPCGAGTFTCGNGKCIPEALICDGSDDCRDNSDENPHNCPFKCAEGMFQCPNNGGCVENTKVCDGKIDCPGISRTFLKGCMSGRCPSNIATDELTSDFFCRRVIGGCVSVTANMYFLRTLNRARKTTEVCDSKINCENMNNTVVRVTCEKGMEVDVANARDNCHVCKDKDECVEYGSCSQLCTNFRKGYSCACQPGFSTLLTQRSGVKHDCVLESDEPASLLLADGSTIRSYDMTRMSGGRPAFMGYSNSTSRIDSIAVDLVGETWSAYLLSYHSKSILRTDITSLRQGKQKRAATNSIKPQPSTAQQPHAMAPTQIIWGNLGDVKSIAYDWVHRNLYWADSSKAVITMLNVDRKMQSTIVTPDSMLMSAIKVRHIRPEYITVDPSISMKIFWTDCCVKPRIWSADLNGSHALMLTHQVAWPSGIVCDVANQRLYWTDSKHGTISTMTIHGLDLRVVYTFTGMRPSMIDVFGRDLVVTSYNRSMVVTLDKFEGLRSAYHNNSLLTVINSQSVHVGDISVVHPAKLFMPSTDAVCECGPNAVITESFHEGLRRCSCVCADDYVRLNVTHCTYCPCKNGGTCSNQPHQLVKCVCPQGTGGTRCELKLCEGYCVGGARCEVFAGKPFCMCPANLQGDRCELSKCNDKSCMNNGTCAVDDGGLTYCTCPRMYTGERCEERVDDTCASRCASSSSHNCTSDPYSCTCKPGYIGIDCQTCVWNNGTDVAGCHGRGYCIFTEGKKHKCVCTVGHFDPITSCLHSVCKNGCLNGGTCSVVSGTGTKCSCPKYFLGKRCEQRTTCVTGYCKNGGTCLETDGPTPSPVSCRCASGYAGDTCDFQCSTPCVGNRVCKVEDLHGVCACPEGFYGDNCEHTTPTSCDNFCQNGGKCLGCNSSEGQNCSSCCHCSCVDGWGGENCADKSEQKHETPSPTGTIAAVCSVLAILILVLIVIITVIYRKRHRRRVLFEHLRLPEDRDDTMHVSNPMYMKSVHEADGLDELEDDDFSVYSATNTSNFANPIFSSRKKPKKKAVEQTLLIDPTREDD